MALNCSVCPTIAENVVGATAMDATLTARFAVAVSLVEILVKPVLVEVKVAVMVVSPSPAAVAVPEAAMEATEVAEDVQVTWVVRSVVVPSDRVPVAVNAWVLGLPPVCMSALAGFTAMDFTVG